MDGVDLNSITPRLGWPYVSMMKDGVPGKARSGLDDAPGMLFGVYNYDKTVVIHNRGSAPHLGARRVYRHGAGHGAKTPN